jgi:site-specific DNA-methyltransferase (adenine-specific)
MEWINRVHQGHALQLLKQMPSDFVDCMVTSPPYWALRDYKTKGITWDSKEDCKHEWGENISVKQKSTPKDWHEETKFSDDITNTFCKKCGAWKGQLGLEPSFDLYVKHLCDIMDEVKRVLKPTGTCWVNLGDTYSGTGCGTGTSHFSQIDKCMKQNVETDLPDKSLCQVPSRFAIEMVNRGWTLRSEIIWQKPNGLPSSIKDRFTLDFEKIFFFVKNRKYYFETLYEDYVSLDKRPAGVVQNREYGYQGKYKVMPPIGGKKQTEGNDNPVYSGNTPEWKQGRIKRCVWSINTHPFPDAHFATFPEELAEPMVQAGSPEFICKKCGKPREKVYTKHWDEMRTATPIKGGETSSSLIDGAGQKKGGFNNRTYPVGVSYEHIGYTDCGCGAEFEGGIVLDIFAGSGTTCLVAKKMGRQYIGLELNPEYVKMAKERIASVSTLHNWVGNIKSEIGEWF